MIPSPSPGGLLRAPLHYDLSCPERPRGVPARAPTRLPAPMATIVSPGQPSAIAAQSWPPTRPVAVKRGMEDKDISGAFEFIQRRKDLAEEVWVP